MPIKKLLFLSSLISLIFFILLSFAVGKGLLRQFDFDTTVRLQGNIAIHFDTFLSSLSFIGSFEVTTLIIFLILAFKRQIKSFIFVFSYTVFHLVEVFGKFFITQSGPPLSFLRTDLPFTIPSSYVHPGFSYPSGHSGRTVFITTILLFFVFRSKRLSKEQKIILTALLVSFDVLMLVSRVSLGEHWATDVLGGALLGFSFAVLSIALL